MEKRNLLYKSAVLGFSLLALWGCKKDNGFKDRMTNSELLVPFAKYLTINLHSTDRVGGAISVQVSASRAFDTGYWGWNDQTGYLANASFLVFNKEISTPLPENSLEFEFFRPFVDGSLPNNYVSTGILRPKAINGYTYVTKDKNGNDVTQSQPNTYEVQYDTSTGDLTAAVKTLFDTSGNQTYKYIYTYAADPRDYSLYYPSGYSLYTGATQTFTGASTTTIEVSTEGNNKFETHTYRNFTSSSTLGDFTDNSFGIKNSATVVKKIMSVGFYKDATTDVSADSINTTTTYYSADTTAVYKEVDMKNYKNWDRRQLKTYTTETYNINSGTETLASRQVINYTDGLETQRTDYSVSGGTASLSAKTTTARNTRGRPVTVTVSNSSSITNYREDYTYDSDFRLSTFRAYNVSSTGVDSCASGYNQTYLQSTDTSGNLIYIVTKTTYSCNTAGTTVDTSTPSAKTVTTYNSIWKPTLIQTYTYTSGAFQLASQLGYSYNNAGLTTQKQSYLVSLGLATSDTYTVYQYDSNGFLTATINYTAGGVIAANYDTTTWAYK
ncbi:MAG: hypothetical protein A2508_07465 [Candidatus Lambdaproteobacteria bacterium RIFOXYD12_FULL_49_8]|uniref:YD repeat-containing protein n=1 Tax=Candidatus Lambdaproteobacteria bacterium RIFOXYD2_FULL_50_16 TaxID=1817772 RepID=A0A1F6GFW6_9PROT|nr:MAG: hypothetical protein A2527_02780 [Candidatus Lambdaproteobacteria bacterium RIFOXYD2_FULL_50_16]OGG98153.1 MAG: hypothetical protein A2508_07465 [Candidatus Lambdaproteobacteria bacterium RIFOXYD12_FULL_49_8]